MTMISAPMQALLGTDAVAHCWTANPDGSPQVSVVWVIAQDDEVLFGTDAGSIKARNIAANPKVILSIEDTERNEARLSASPRDPGNRIHRARAQPGADGRSGPQVHRPSPSPVGDAGLADQCGRAGRHRSDQRRGPMDRRSGCRLTADTSPSKLTPRSSAGSFRNRRSP
ncbi:MAG: pyridoxamine 5'-phosphate oxidase family protein [Acidimicrobiales bacterium]